MARWFGPSVVLQDTVEATMDVRPGGSFQVSFNSEDGEYHRVGGVYREVVPNQRLVFSWAWYTTPERESLVTVTLKREGDHTLLTLLHEQLFDEATKAGHTRGWTGSMDKLEAMFA
ncbi:SRPBCC domain-containing protein [Afipia sp. P52-10]|uniref:SRPBCC family protein n=1 Tax=Afipia sp. P52-10 TaxID=1429916 RepID=UPI001FCA66CA|nr:SRPBCC domain-containing protein [Afipia sp. P52-10]